MKNILTVSVLLLTSFLFGCETPSVTQNLPTIDTNVPAVEYPEEKQVVEEKKVEDTLPLGTKLAFSNSVTVSPEKITLEFAPQSTTPSSYDVKYFIQEEDGESVEATENMKDISATRPLRIEIEELSPETEYVIGVFVLDKQGNQVHSFEDTIRTNAKEDMIPIPAEEQVKPVEEASAPEAEVVNEEETPPAEETLVEEETSVVPEAETVEDVQSETAETVSE